MASKGQQVEVQGMMLYREELRNIRAADDYELAGRFFYALIDFFIDGEENDHELNKRDVTMLEIMREKISRDANKVIQKKIEGEISGIQGAIETEYRKNGQALSKEQAKSLARQEYERRHKAGGTSEVPSLTVPVSVSPSVTPTVAVAEAVAEATTPSLSESVTPTVAVAGAVAEATERGYKGENQEVTDVLDWLKTKNFPESQQLIDYVKADIDKNGRESFVNKLSRPVFINELRRKAEEWRSEQQTQR